MADIFDPDADLTVEFESLELDMPARAASRTLDFFSRSANLQALICVLADMEQELYDATVGVLRGFTLADADTYALDLLGRWVGQNRSFTTDNDEYRRLLLSKIFKNHVRGGTIPELIQFSLLFTGRNISFRLIDQADFEMIVPDDLDPDDLANLLLVFTDNAADSKHFLPLGATGRIVSVRTISGTVMFTFDNMAGRWDFARWGVSIPN